MTENITSWDGTTLAVDTVGEGAPVILIGGAFNDRSTVAGLAAALAPKYTAVTYDRRGRVGSDDKGSGFVVQNEIADLAAVIEHVGGRAHLFGHSSGAILALEAVMHDLPVDRVAIYESPYRADPNLPHPPAEFLDRLKAAVAAGDREAAASIFLGEAMGVPPQGLEAMKQGPGWDFLLDKALTLPYDVELSKPWEMVDRDRLAAIKVPVLAMYGDQTFPGLMAGAKVVAESVPGAELVVIPGEDHGVLNHPNKLESALSEFFG